MSNVERVARVQRPALAVWVVLVVAGFWIVYVARITAPDDPAPPLTAMHEPAPRIEVAASRLPAAAASLPARRVLVVDAADRPVAGACAIDWPHPARAVARRHAAVLAESAADGILALPTSSPIRRVAVCAEGFASTWLDAAEPLDAGRARLVLRRGEPFVVLCTDLAGRPLAGVDVVLARATGPSGAPEVPDGPVFGSPEAECALHAARSGADGRAVCTGLTAGAHGLWVAAAGWIPLRGFDGQLLQVPGPAHTVAFARAVGLVVQGTGRVVGSSTSPRTSQGPQTSARSRALDDEAKRLRARFPDALVFVGSEGDGESAMAPLECTLVIAHRGLHRAHVPLRYVTEIDVPTMLGPESLVEAMEFGTVTCSVVDARGQPYRPADLRVAQGPFTDWRRPAGGRVEPGESVVLPVGSYSVSSLDPVERHVLMSAPRFRVRAGEATHHVVALPTTLRRCRVRAELAGGLTFDVCRFRAACPTLPALSQRFPLEGTADGRLIALPCAPIEVEAWALGFGSLRRRVLVEPGAEDLPLTLTFGGGT